MGALPDCSPPDIVSAQALADLVRLPKRQMAQLQKAVRQLLAGTSGVNARNAYGETPLMRVCQGSAGVGCRSGGGSGGAGGGSDSGGCDEQQRLTTLLLLLGADANVRDGSGNTPLHAAARGGAAATVSALLAAGADDAAANSFGSTCYHYAAVSSNAAALFDLLLAEAPGGAEAAEKQDGAGNTPLHVASQLGRAGAVDALLAAGADATVRNGERKVAADLAWGETAKVFAAAAAAGGSADVKAVAQQDS
eukprot:Rhum_TRINITY_DN2377_c0_g1::Rhum_TRINITY_DN2377_c0_g1_i1::g.7018::m.7018